MSNNARPDAETWGNEWDPLLPAPTTQQDDSDNNNNTVENVVGDEEDVPTDEEMDRFLLLPTSIATATATDIASTRTANTLATNTPTAATVSLPAPAPTPPLPRCRPPLIPASHRRSLSLGPTTDTTTTTTNNNNNPTITTAERLIRTGRCRKKGAHHRPRRRLDHDHDPHGHHPSSAPSSSTAPSAQSSSSMLWFESFSGSWDSFKEAMSAEMLTVQQTLKDELDQVQHGRTYFLDMSLTHGWSVLPDELPELAQHIMMSRRDRDRRDEDGRPRASSWAHVPRLKPLPLPAFDKPLDVEQQPLAPARPSRLRNLPSKRRHSRAKTFPVSARGLANWLQ